jgi:protein-tyrosine phosphatase
MINFLSKEGKVYVHCQAGINRSGFLVLAFLCLEKKFNIEQLELSIIKRRPCALTNKSFRNEIYKKVKDFLLDQ